MNRNTNCCNIQTIPLIKLPLQRRSSFSSAILVHSGKIINPLCSISIHIRLVCGILHDTHFSSNLCHLVYLLVPFFHRRVQVPMIADFSVTPYDHRHCWYRLCPLDIFDSVCKFYETVWLPVSLSIPQFPYSFLLRSRQWRCLFRVCSLWGCCSIFSEISIWITKELPPRRSSWAESARWLWLLFFLITCII